MLYPRLLDVYVDSQLLIYLTILAMLFSCKIAWGPTPLILSVHCQPVLLHEYLLYEDACWRMVRPLLDSTSNLAPNSSMSTLTVFS